MSEFRDRWIDESAVMTSEKIEAVKRLIATSASGKPVICMSTEMHENIWTEPASHRVDALRYAMATLEPIQRRETWIKRLWSLIVSVWRRAFRR